MFRIANPGDVIQFFKKGDVFRIKNKQHVNDCEMEIEPCDYVFNLEDEIQYQDGDLKQFISENVKYDYSHSKYLFLDQYLFG